MPTPWPELWEGTGVHFVRQDRGLRTQSENAAAADPGTWSAPPADAAPVEMSYTRALRSGERTIFGEIRRQTGVNLAEPEYRIEIPARWRSRLPAISARKLAVFHPPTIRTEWPAPSRNPRAEYMRRILEWLKDDGFTVVAIGHTLPGVEDVVGDYRGFDFEFMHGELHYTAVLALIAEADISVSPVGFFLPAALATKARALIVFGGHVPPRPLIDDMAHDGFHHVAPGSPCYCVDRRHNCDKSINPDRLRATYEAATR